jgi:hypothetical protein
MSPSNTTPENGVQTLLRAVEENPYSPDTRLKLALKYAALKYPDLAVGEAYMALLLCDEIYEDDSEFHVEAFEAASIDSYTSLQDKLKSLSLSNSNIIESASSSIQNWIETNVEQQA